MITEKDLQEAIAECEGQRNPNANTCIKLAAFYIIRKELFKPNEEPDDKIHGYSYKSRENSEFTRYSGDSELATIINGKPLEQVLSVFDELMASLQVVEPRLYAAVLRKLND